ncbi:hypothetical protein AAGG52_20145 [Bacillus licheniformis]
MSLLLLLTGCWDSRQIEQLSIAIGLGVDKGEDDKNVKLTYQFLVPKRSDKTAALRTRPKWCPPPETRFIKPSVPPL